MIRFVSAFVVTMGCVFTVTASAQDHLEPEDGLLTTNWQWDYDRLVS